MLRFLTFLVLLPTLAVAQMSPEPRDISPEAGKILAPVAVQSGGRPKPFDSFARFNLLAVYHKSTLKTDNEKITASQWLSELVLDPESAYKVKCFLINNEDLATDLGLDYDKKIKNYYSFNQLRSIMDAQLPRVKIIGSRKKQDRSPIEKQLFNLYNNVWGYYTVSRSFTCLTPEFIIDNKQLAKELDLPVNQSVSFFQLYQRWETFRPLVGKLKGSFDANNPYHAAIFKLASQIKNLQQFDAKTGSIAIVPNEGDPLFGTWLTPWQVLDSSHQATPQEINILTELEATFSDLIHNDATSAQKHIDAIQSLTPAKVNALTKAEIFYNRLDAFTNSIAFYILGFIFLCFSWLLFGKQLRWASWSVVLVGLLIHTVGILLRMYIRGRPAPVTNIYESVIFVGFTCVLLGLIIEWKRRDGLGLILATIPGIILHFVGFKYAMEGDTMGRLVAVLDSNFWLSTHVVTITIGYGAAAIAGFIANCYLVVRLFKPYKKELIQSISKNFTGITLLALLFCIVGTILGGIWGDQSWGRFWGWDPKENGALLICLWLLIVLHGKWGKQFKTLGFATMLALTNITVLLAWFGVNLLGVGLHSYGFTEGAAMNLAIACASIFLMTIIPTALIYFRDLATPKI
jgi:ABC-type transport system involved in cytochrome c biogenesis permease subunit